MALNVAGFERRQRQPPSQSLDQLSQALQHE
jgi:hypothetical protein